MPDARTVLGFDYGVRRIGVAVGNTLTGTAQPLTVIANRGVDQRFDAIKKLLDEWRPQLCAVGVPVHPDGTPHQLTQQCRRFGNQLHGRFGVAVAWVDERYSSVAAAANETGAGLDADAACVILQQYLDEAATAAMETR